MVSRARGDNDERSVSALIFQDQEWLAVISTIENADTLSKIDCVRFESTKISSELYKNILKEKKLYMSKINLKLEKFRKAFMKLEDIYLKPTTEDRAYIDATIQRFEFTFELAWKFLKEYFSQKGTFLHYPKEVIKEAFVAGIINDESLWIYMLTDRSNMISYTYDKKLADEIYNRIRNYVPELKKLLNIIDLKI
nr:nucleotidyltransferase substrate binding protein [Rickettsia sibirica]